VPTNVAYRQEDPAHQANCRWQIPKAVNQAHHQTIACHSAEQDRERASKIDQAKALANLAKLLLDERLVLRFARRLGGRT
jgi:hypothetical protein